MINPFPDESWKLQFSQADQTLAEFQPGHCPVVAAVAGRATQDAQGVAVDLLTGHVEVFPQPELGLSCC